MYPDLIDLGFLHLKTYGACMAVGFLLCWKIVERLSGRRDYADLLMSLMVSGVLGARAAYVIEHWRSEFAANPAAIIRIDQGGLMFYGGLILAVIVFFVWCHVKKVRPLDLADLLCTVIPLGHACGRIGCFFYGCCYGRVSSSPLAVSFPHHSVAWYEQVRQGLIPATATSTLPVLPTQLFEAAALLVLFAFLFFRYRYAVISAPTPQTPRTSQTSRTSSPAHTAALYLVGYAVIRFGMEFLRGDPRAAFLGLSIGQLISIGLVLAAAVFYIRGRVAARPA